MSSAASDVYKRQEYTHGIQNNFIFSKQKYDMNNKNKPYGIMKINYSMMACFSITPSNSVDSKKLTFLDKNSISSLVTIKTVILKSEALKTSIPFCKC